jgi:hypothetical protein
MNGSSPAMRPSTNSIPALLNPDTQDPLGRQLRAG